MVPEVGLEPTRPRSLGARGPCVLRPPTVPGAGPLPRFLRSFAKQLAKNLENYGKEGPSKTQLRKHVLRGKAGSCFEEAPERCPPGAFPDGPPFETLLDRLRWGKEMGGADPIETVGAGDGFRTRDLKLGKLALYLLSYARLLLFYGLMKAKSRAEGNFLSKSSIKGS